MNEDIIEKVNENKTPEKGNEFFLSHRHVIRESEETTKITIVYDVSVKPNKDSVSLNECLETGTPLQNSLWNILLRLRFRPLQLRGDIKKAFLHIRIPEYEREMLRFHWAVNCDPNVIEKNRFIRLVFSPTQSPFILEGILKSTCNIKLTNTQHLFKLFRRS